MIDLQVPPTTLHSWFTSLPWRWIINTPHKSSSTVSKSPKSNFLSSFRCHNQIEVCSPNPCPGGFDCKVTDGSIHCDPLPQVSGNNKYLVKVSQYWWKWHLTSIYTLNLTQSIHFPVHLSGISNDRLHGNHGDQCHRARVTLLGRHLRVHQETLRSAEEEKARLCPGLQWVRAKVCVRIGGQRVLNLLEIQWEVAEQQEKDTGGEFDSIRNRIS